MQLLKITTTPIKYRIESERASITLADPDLTKNFQQVQRQVIQQHVKAQLSSRQDLNSSSDVISADNSEKIRADSLINSSFQKKNQMSTLLSTVTGRIKNPYNLI